MDTNNDKANNNQQGSSGSLVEYLVCNLKVKDSCTSCVQIFSGTPPENSRGMENAAENSGTNGENFFCFMYEFSLRHPVWVAEINVKASNCAGLKRKYLLTFLKSPHVLVKIQ